jgi:hypothetical protein
MAVHNLQNYRWNKYCKALERPFCFDCHRPESKIDYYTLNPPGGFGIEELLICTDCLRKPENSDILQILKDRGCEDLEEFGG